MARGEVPLLGDARSGADQLVVRVLGIVRAVERAPDVEAGLLDDVQVDHGRPNVAVTHDVLERADVAAAAERLGGKGMAEGVTRRALRDAAAADGLFHLTLHG